jgi:hypothetical protein
MSCERETKVGLDRLLTDSTFCGTVAMLYKTRISAASVRCGRFRTLWTGDRIWVNYPPSREFQDELLDRLARLDSPDIPDQLAGLGWFNNQLRVGRIFLGSEEIPKIVEFLRSPDPEVRRVALTLTNTLAGCESEVGFYLIRNDLVAVLDEFHGGIAPSLTADLMRSSRDAKEWFLERGVVQDAIRQFGVYLDDDFLDLAGACVLRQNYSPEYETMFRMAASTIQSADTTTFCKLIIALRCFVSADARFICLFFDLGMLPLILSRETKSTALTCEVLWLLIKISGKPGEWNWSETLVQNGVYTWITPLIGPGKQLKPTLFLVANLFLRAEGSVAYLLEICPIVFNLFESGKFRRKQLIVSVLIAAVLRIPQDEIMEIQPCVPLILDSPSLIPSDDRATYLATLRKLLDGPDEIVCEFSDAIELREWLEVLMAETDKALAERATHILGILDNLNGESDALIENQTSPDGAP